MLRMDEMKIDGVKATTTRQRAISTRGPTNGEGCQSLALGK